MLRKQNADYGEWRFTRPTRWEKKKKKEMREEKSPHRKETQMECTSMIWIEISLEATPE